jgi:xanthine dehydrogenase YagR molybdenum-binding subunit
MRYVNDNLADYLVPVNADVPSVEVTRLSEQDEHINPDGVKGLGELGNVGNAAVCNAIFPAPASVFGRCRRPGELEV